jgi:Ca2+-binding RTX toxin-like protein
MTTEVRRSAINGTGNSLNNTIVGNSAANVLDGRLGSDKLIGGGGADRFLFDTALSSSNVDTITDFSHSGGDRIELDHAIFTALQSVTLGTAIASSDFYVSRTGTAHLSTDHILYDTLTGALSYDPDGTGSQQAVQFAVLSGHPTLTAPDFLLV